VSLLEGKGRGSPIACYTSKHNLSEAALFSLEYMFALGELTMHGLYVFSIG
jgi:hypothetical protein